MKKCFYIDYYHVVQQSAVSSSDWLNLLSLWTLTIAYLVKH